MMMKKSLLKKKRECLSILLATSLLLNLREVAPYLPEERFILKTIETEEKNTYKLKYTKKIEKSNLPSKRYTFEK